MFCEISTKRSEAAAVVVMMQIFTVCYYEYAHSDDESAFEMIALTVLLTT